MVAAAALLALLGPQAARADTLESKRAEAARLTDDLAGQAQRVVAADRRYRAAQARMTDAAASIRQAEKALQSALGRQAEARRRLAGQAIDAYTHGGSVSVLGRRLRATSNLAVYDTYLGLVAGLDRSAVESLRGAREDLGARRAALGARLERARSESARLADERSSLAAAEEVQRSNLTKVKGDVAQLVAAEQARRATEASARITAAAVPVPAAAAPTARPAPKASPAPPAAAPAGDPFACIRQLESGNNYRAPGGGAYQFQDATWRSLGYSGSAQDAPPAVQDAAARQLQARDGWRPWTTAAACGLV